MKGVDTVDVMCSKNENQDFHTRLRTQNKRKKKQAKHDARCRDAGAAFGGTVRMRTGLGGP